MEVDQVEAEAANGDSVKSEGKGKVLVNLGIKTVALNLVHFLPTFKLESLSWSGHSDCVISATISRKAVSSYTGTAMMAVLEKFTVERATVFLPSI